MLVIRSDITQKLRSAKLLLINLKIFCEQEEDCDYGTIWDRDAGKVRGDMDLLGVKAVGYRSNSKPPLKSARNHGIENIIINGDKKKGLIKYFDGQYSFKDIVLLGAEVSDIEIAGLSRFSVATAQSPLELQMGSDYVSNFSGDNAYQEIGNLIINAKGPY